MLKKVTALAFGAAAFAMVASVGHAASKCSSANIKFAGKLAFKVAGCVSKAIKKDTAADYTAAATCVSDNKAKFDAAWAKSITKGDCRTDTSNAARDAIKALVDGLQSDLEAQLCTGGTCNAGDGISKCTSARMKAAGKKAFSLSKCVSKMSKKGEALDPLCITKAQGKFSNGVDGAYEKASSKADCQTDAPGANGALVEADVDTFNDNLTTSLTALSFTTTAGTADCGGGGIVPPAAAPHSGALYSNTACTTNITDLGLGCLYFGGGGATTVPPGRIPDAATNTLGLVNATTLGPSTGQQSSKECTRGDGPGLHCVNNNSLPACVNDAGCGGTAGSCALDANCYFGPPLPIVGVPASLTTCVLNVIATDASGTVNQATGASTVSLPLLSRVYITGNSASPCPKCVKNKCDATWKTNTATTSPDTGLACTAVGALGTSHDCRPSLPGFQAPLGVDLTPLTTGTASRTDAAGLVCTPQNNAGAFGHTTTRCIQEIGSPAGATTGGPQAAKLGSVFCIPATGNGAIDGVADLPGPGAIGLNGTVAIN